MVSRNKEIPPLAVPCLVCCSVTSVLFVSGILGFLKFGALVVLVCGLLAIPLWLITSFETRALVHVTGIYMFIVLFSYLRISSDHAFWSSDEFSHWGLAIKSMFEEQALWDESSLGFAKSYPPGQPLFQYFMIAHENWSEAIVYRSQTVFIVSAVLAVIGWMISSATGKVIAFALIIVTPLTLGLTYGVLLPEMAQSFLFATAISIAITGLTPSKLVMLMLVIFNLALLKDTALLLGAVVVLLVWWSSKSGYSFSSRPWKQNLVYASGAASALALPFAAWQLYLRSIMVKLPGSTVLAESGSDNLVGGVLAAAWDKISLPYFPTIFNLQSQKFAIPDVKLSLLQLILVILVVHIAIVLFGHKSKRRIAAIQVAVILFGLVVFSLAHVVLYITLFTEYEALRTAAFERYLSVYLIAWLAVVISLSISRTEKLKRAFRNTVAKKLVVRMVALLAIGLVGLLLFDPRVTPQPSESKRARQEIQLAASALQTLIKPADRVFFIYEEPAYINNFEVAAYYIFRFAMFPHGHVSQVCIEVYTPGCFFNDNFNEYDYVLTMNPTERTSRISPSFKSESLTRVIFQIFEVKNDPALGTQLVLRNVPQP